MASTQGEGSGPTKPSQHDASSDAPQYDPCQCDYCPFGASPEQLKSTLDYETVKKSAESCRACAGIVSFLNARNLKPIKLDYNTNMTANLKFASGSDSPTYEFFVKDYKEDTASGLRLNFGEIPRLRLPSGNTSDTAAFDTLKRWIYRCKAEHEECQPKADKKMPHRVLEIKSIEPLRIRLVENCARLEDYACLSHRWGPETKSKSLNAGNLNLYEAEVPEDKFYHLVKDAIVAVSRLGLQFVWIDCYCIIQDDQGDWEVEAANMADIYEGALLTISATFSEEGGSMFSIMPSEAFLVTEVRGEPVYIRKQLPHPCHVEYNEERLSGPSLRRAWVFQERLLSNRFIHFTRGEIFWECRQSTWCECGSRQGEWIRKRMEGARTIGDQTWNLITEQYNDTQLTFEKDRLPALAGVAQRYAKLRGDWTYLAGLWKEDLPYALAWRKSWCNEPRPLEQLVPTWSWASLPRGKDLNTTRFGGSVLLVGYKIGPSAADIYMGAKGTEIMVAGYTLDLTVYKESDEVLVGRHGKIFLKLGPDFKTDPDNDTEFRAVPDGSSCLLLLLFDDLREHGPYNVFGIVLLPQNGSADGEDAKYERIGYIGNHEFEFSHEDLSDDYAGYCGGRFPPSTDPKHPPNPPTYEWLLNSVERKQVTLV